MASIDADMEKEWILAVNEKLGKAWAQISVGMSRKKMGTGQPRELVS